MNERINKLADQAGLGIQHNGIVLTKNVNAAEAFEQFAELIVRECINIACEYDRPKLSGPGLAIASYIESHFDIYIEEDGRFVK